VKHPEWRTLRNKKEIISGSGGLKFDFDIGMNINWIPLPEIAYYAEKQMDGSILLINNLFF